MKLDYQTTDTDYIDFYEFNARNTPQGKKAMRTQKLSIPVILMLVLLGTVIWGFSMGFILIQLVLYAVFSILWSRYLDKMVRKTAEGTLMKLKQKGQTPYSPKGELEFGETEITDQRPGHKVTAKYSDIVSVYENGRAIYLYLSERSRILLIPASAFADDDGKAALMELLHEKIASEKFCTAAEK